MDIDTNVDTTDYDIWFLNQLKTVILAPVNTIDGKQMKIVPDSVFEQLFTTERFKIFRQSFTHESYDYNNSYESIETHGDTMINTITDLVIAEHFPYLDPSEVSNMLAYYKSNAY